MHRLQTRWHAQVSRLRGIRRHPHQLNRHTARFRRACSSICNRQPGGIRATRTGVPRYVGNQHSHSTFSLKCAESFSTSWTCCLRDCALDNGRYQHASKPARASADSLISALTFLRVISSYRQSRSGLSVRRRTTVPQPSRDVPAGLKLCRHCDLFPRVIPNFRNIRVLNWRWEIFR